MWAHFKTFFSKTCSSVHITHYSVNFIGLQRRPINIPVPVNFWNLSDWQWTRLEWQNKGVASKGQTSLWRIVNRNSVRRTVAADGWWSLEEELVAGVGLDSWYKTGSRWIGGHLCRISICWCRKVVICSGLVAGGSCWYRKMDASSGQVAGGSYWCRKVIAAAGRRSLVPDW